MFVPYNAFDMNKYLKYLVAVAAALAMSACEEEENIYFVSTETLTDQCTDNGVWSACFSNNSGFDLDGLHFSHASSQEPYLVWSGFCPSAVRDAEEYSDSEWPDHQWATIAGHSVQGDYEASYLVAYWDTMDEGSCVITGTGGITFKPYDVYVSNTTWGYYAMKNGTAFSEPLAEDGWFKLTITGYRKGIVAGSIDVMLADKGIPSREWNKVKLKSLGLIDEMVFSLSSSDTGEWGMNIPAYFCIDGLHLY